MIDNQELLTQIQHELKYGLDAVQQKRTLFRERLKKYIEPNKEEDKVSNNTLYAMVNLFVAVNYQDKLTALFVPRKFGAEEYAENLTALAKYDQEEMELGKLNFQKYWDQAMFGVGIRVKSGWDDLRKTPLFTVKDPLSWIPDPFGNHIDKFRFHYFEEQMMKSEMTEDRGFIKSEVEKIGFEKNTEIQNTENYKNQNQGINSVNETELQDNKLCSIYNGFTIYDGKKYLVTVDDSQKLLLRVEEITPVMQEEKEDGTQIEFPVVISWFSPYRGDPFGVSLADLVEDKQKANQLLLNLRLINAKFSTLGQQYLYDPTAVKNRLDLTAPTTNPKWIAYNSASGTPISNAVYPVPRQNIMADSFNVTSELSNQMQLETGMDNRSLGVPGDKTTTLGEAQQIQANANIRLGLNVEINNWSEKEFWKLWYRCYQEYFGKADIKLIRISSGFGISNIEFRKDDFIGKGNIDIVVENAKVVEQQREKMKINFAAKLPLILQSPNIPQVSKNIALRYSFKLDGMDREYTNLLVPPTVEELNAEQKITLINNEDPLGAEIDEWEEDHYTYLIMFERARDNKIKQQAIEKRKMAIIETGQNKMLQQESGAVNSQANAMASQMGNAAIQQGGKQITSLQNV